MKFEVKIHKLIENGKPLKASASVVIDGQYVVHNVRVIKTDKGLFMGMPFESFTDKDGVIQRKDVFHPINSEARQAMQDAVLAAYEKKISENADETN